MNTTQALEAMKQTSRRMAIRAGVGRQNHLGMTFARDVRAEEDIGGKMMGIIVGIAISVAALAYMLIPSIEDALDLSFFTDHPGLAKFLVFVVFIVIAIIVTLAWKSVKGKSSSGGGGAPRRARRGAYYR
ncbi:MAG TPA: hypothetical protein VM286_04355 [Candidatus Thermoplasmatota archaeon]|nr:hypothetical protein [Candidatus Thermoplasmatota archaeon]